MHPGGDVQVSGRIVKLEIFCKIQSVGSGESRFGFDKFEVPVGKTGGNLQWTVGLQGSEIGQDLGIFGLHGYLLNGQMADCDIGL